MTDSTQKNVPHFFFISGPPRTGTTFFAKEIHDAWPKPKQCFRESGVTKAIHEMICALDFNRREHKWGFDLVGTENQELRTSIIRHVQSLALELYSGISKTDQLSSDAWILDKDPIIFPDGKEMYLNIREVFPDSRFLILIRDYRFILNSMIQRKFSRGPYPRPNVLSPYAFGAKWIENVNCDVPAQDTSENFGFLHEQAPWSFRKCCVNLRNSINAIHDALPGLGESVRILRYEDLSQGDKVLRMLRDFTGVELESDLPFSPKTSEVHFSHSDQLVIERELESTGTLDKIAHLEKLASQTLEGYA